jgi:acylglycerol lipase
MRHEEGYFEGLKGLRLYYQAWIPDQPKAVVQFMHGFSEHSGHFPFLVERLLASGYAMYVKDHRGHGRSEGEKTDVDSYLDYVEDEKRMRDIISGKHPGIPVFVIGYSLGAVLAGNFAVQYEQLVKGVVLVSIGSRIKVNPLERFLLNLLLAIRPRRRFWVKLEGKTLTSNPEMARSYDSDPLIVHLPSTFRQTRESLRGFEAIVKHATQLGLPLLV